MITFYSCMTLKQTNNIASGLHNPCLMWDFSTSLKLKAPKLPKMQNAALLGQVSSTVSLNKCIIYAFPHRKLIRFSVRYIIFEHRRKTFKWRDENFTIQTIWGKTWVFLKETSWRVRADKNQHHILCSTPVTEEKNNRVCVWNAYYGVCPGYG